VSAGHPAEALEAYEAAASLGGQSLSPAVARPRLLRESGQAAKADKALRQLHALSWNTDPWIVLEVAWRELPPPRRDEILVGQDDYGAVRGFFHPRGLDPSFSRHRREWNRYDLSGRPQPPPGPHRWTRRRAWLRLVPTMPARAYDVTMTMGAPFPSTLSSPTVEVRVNDGEPHRFALGPDLRSYTLRAAVPVGRPLVVGLEAPTWCRVGEPADQGVRVDRLAVAPAPP
jgi:hypothetical protein